MSDLQSIVDSVVAQAQPGEQIEAYAARGSETDIRVYQGQVENFVAGGLKDFSISRVDLPWGIPVPGHPGHTFYVWFDALLGYLSALLDHEIVERQVKERGALRMELRHHQILSRGIDRRLSLGGGS